MKTDNEVSFLNKIVNSIPMKVVAGATAFSLLMPLGTNIKKIGQFFNSDLYAQGTKLPKPNLEDEFQEGLFEDTTVIAQNDKKATEVGKTAKEDFAKADPKVGGEGKGPEKELKDIGIDTAITTIYHNKILDKFEERDSKFIGKYVDILVEKDSIENVGKKKIALANKLFDYLKENDFWTKKGDCLYRNPEMTGTLQTILQKEGFPVDVTKTYGACFYPKKIRDKGTIGEKEDYRRNNFSITAKSVFKLQGLFARPYSQRDGHFGETGSKGLKQYMAEKNKEDLDKWNVGANAYHKGLALNTLNNAKEYFAFAKSPEGLSDDLRKERIDLLLEASATADEALKTAKKIANEEDRETMKTDIGSFSKMVNHYLNTPEALDKFIKDNPVDTIPAVDSISKIVDTLPPEFTDGPNVAVNKESKTDRVVITGNTNEGAVIDNQLLRIGDKTVKLRLTNKNGPGYLAAHRYVLPDEMLSEKDTIIFKYKIKDEADNKSDIYVSKAFLGKDRKQRDKLELDFFKTLFSTDVSEKGFGIMVGVNKQSPPYAHTVDKKLGITKEFDVDAWQTAFAIPVHPRLSIDGSFNLDWDRYKDIHNQSGFELASSNKITGDGMIDMSVFVNDVLGLKFGLGYMRSNEHTKQNQINDNINVIEAGFYPYIACKIGKQEVGENGFIQGSLKGFGAPFPYDVWNPDVCTQKLANTAQGYIVTMDVTSPSITDFVNVDNAFAEGLLRNTYLIGQVEKTKLDNQNIDERYRSTSASGGMAIGWGYGFIDGEFYIIGTVNNKKPWVGGELRKDKTGEGGINFKVNVPGKK